MSACVRQHHGVHIDGAATTIGAPAPAAQVQHERLAHQRCAVAGIRTGGAAATADRLQDHRMRTRAIRGRAEQAAGGVHVDGAALAAGASLATHADQQGRRVSRFIGDVGRAIGSLAAAAADGLRQQAIGHIPVGRQLRCVRLAAGSTGLALHVQREIAAVATDAALAAHGNRQVQITLGALGGRRAAHAATAANGLHHHAVGKIPLGGRQTSVVDGDCAATAASATFAPHGDRQRIRTEVGVAGRVTARVAARIAARIIGIVGGVRIRRGPSRSVRSGRTGQAAATADGLQQDAVGVIAQRCDGAGMGQQHGAAVAARAAILTHRDADRCRETGGGCVVAAS
ncbi:hypothetical protein D3C72_522570 [compost metagenome]